jgi:spermidine synthase
MPQIPSAASATPEIERDDDSLTLSFAGDLIQSRMRLDDPMALDLQYSQVMMAFTMFLPQPRRTLMIGLGGGSLVRHLLHHFPGVQLTVVEINPAVLEARDTFQIPLDGPSLQTVCGDGATFLRSTPPQSYDLILVDAFDETGEPEGLSNTAFYRSCRDALTPEGVLVVNLLDREPRCSTLIGRIWSVFGEPVLPLEVECEGNRVVLASSDEVFRHCARNLRQQWQQLLPVHQEMLDGLQDELEEVLQPWAARAKTAPQPSKGKRRGKGAAPKPRP